jgi:hypothetical protein
MQPSNQNHRDALHAYDPSRGEPPTDACAKALEATLSDPELRQWWEQEQAVDNSIRSKLTGCAIPEDLKEKIFAKAAGELVAAQSAPEAKHQQPEEQGNRWHWSVFAGAAAAIALLALAYTFIFPPTVGSSEPTPQLAQLMVSLEDVLGDAAFKPHKANNYSSLVSHLETGGAPTPKYLPTSISNTEGFACANLLIDGIPVGMMCFKTADNSVFHIFTVDRKYLPEQPDMPKSHVRTIDNHSCATWTREDQIYVLATKESPDRVITML